MPAPNDPLIGQVVGKGRYRVDARLGEGGMGFVYRAFDLNLGADVVMKVPRRSMMEDPEFAERFTREIRALVVLSHPNVVPVTDVGLHDDLPFAVMKYLPGGSLDDRRRDEQDRPRRMEPASLSAWLPGVAAALDYVHAQGFVHRDVKPANVLFDSVGHVYLGDFGIARVVSAELGRREATLTSTGMVLGTPEYMAPEVIMGRPFDGRADQYALGVLAFELLAGRRPFDGPTPAAILVQQSTQEPPRLTELVPGVPEALAFAVHRALAKESEGRFPNCDAFARAVLGTIGAPAARPAGAAPVGKPARLACPKCRAMQAVPAEFRGRRVKCNVCGMRLRVSDRLDALEPLDAPAVTGETTVLPAVRPMPDRGSTRPDLPARPPGSAPPTVAEVGYDLGEPVAPPRRAPASPPRPLVPEAPAPEPPGGVQPWLWGAGAAAGVLALAAVGVVLLRGRAGPPDQAPPKASVAGPVAPAPRAEDRAGSGARPAETASNPAPDGPVMGAPTPPILAGMSAPPPGGFSPPTTVGAGAPGLMQTADGAMAAMPTSGAGFPAGPGASGGPAGFRGLPESQPAGLKLEEPTEVAWADLAEIPEPFEGKLVRPSCYFEILPARGADGPGPAFEILPRGVGVGKAASKRTTGDAPGAGEPLALSIDKPLGLRLVQGYRSLQADRFFGDLTLAVEKADDGWVARIVRVGILGVPDLFDLYAPAAKKNAIRPWTQVAYCLLTEKGTDEATIDGAEFEARLDERTRDFVKQKVLDRYRGAIANANRARAQAKVGQTVMQGVMNGQEQARQTHSYLQRFRSGFGF